MPRWAKAFGLIATIQAATDLPPFVWGDWAAIALRVIFMGLAYLLAYGTVTANAPVVGRERSERTSPPPCSQFFPLFDHMSREHGLTLTDSELYEIMRVVEPMVEPKCKATCTANKEITRKGTP